MFNFSFKIILEFTYSKLGLILTPKLAHLMMGLAHLKIGYPT